MIYQTDDEFIYVKKAAATTTRCVGLSSLKEKRINKAALNPETGF